jgi:hypothetical protein
MSGSEGLWDLAFVALQVFQLAFLLLHDWIPLGRFNDLAGVRSQVSRPALAVGTLVSSLPVAFTLVLSIWYLGQPYPTWVKWWLVATFGLLFLGELQAWWVPYLFGARPKLVARYQAMFGRTHSFLPTRHGIMVNTAHFALHVGMLLTLALAIYFACVR